MRQLLNTMTGWLMPVIPMLQLRDPVRTMPVAGESNRAMRRAAGERSSHGLETMAIPRTR